MLKKDKSDKIMEKEKEIRRKQQEKENAISELISFVTADNSFGNLSVSFIREFRDFFPFDSNFHKLPFEKSKRLRTECKGNRSADLCYLFEVAQINQEILAIEHKVILLSEKIS